MWPPLAVFASDGEKSAWVSRRPVAGGLGEPNPGQAEGGACDCDGAACAPADGGSRQAVQDEQPARGEGRRHVQPIRDRAGRIPAQLDQRNAARQREAGADEQQHDGEKRQAEPYGQPVWTADGAAKMQRSVDDGGQCDGEPQNEVAEEHRLIQRPFQARALEPLQQRNRAEIDRVDDQQREQHQHRHQQLAQYWPDDLRRSGAVHLAFAPG